MGIDWSKSNLYKFLQDEKEEIQKHKWLEWEKAGYDIGQDSAVLSWVKHHRRKWMEKEVSEIRATFSGDM